MRFGLVVVATAVACSSRVAPDVATAPAVASATERVELRRTQSVASFAGDIPASAEGGECQTRTIPGRGQQVGLAFPDIANAARHVWLTYDETGTLIAYADTRGDLVRKVVGPDGGPPRPDEPIRALPPVGRQTSIHIDLRNNVAVAQNIGGDGEQQTAIGQAASFMTAENLGNPAAMVQLITSRCGRP